MTTWFHDNDDGTFTIESVADVEPILDSNKRAQNESPGEHVATIPDVILYGWLNKDGVSYRQFNQDPEVFERMVRKYLNDPDWRWLKRVPGRI